MGKKTHLPEVGHSGGKWALGGNVRRISWVMVHLQEQESGYKAQSQRQEDTTAQGSTAPAQGC